eukprot:c20973_g1_i1 orf=837-1901(+)
MQLQRLVAVPTENSGNTGIGQFSRSGSLVVPKGVTCCDIFTCSRLKNLVCVVRASQRIVTRSAREGCNNALNKVAKKKRDLHSNEDNTLGVELKAGSDGCNQKLAVGHANSTVSSPSVALKSAIEDAATLQLASKSPLTGDHRGLQSRRLQVAVDVDEVLGSFLCSLNTFIAEQHLLKYDIAEYHVYDFMKVWGCSQAEANDRVHAFFESEHFKDGIIPIPGAHRSLLQLAEFCHLVVVTSRQHVIRNQTLDWIERHYSGIFSDVYFGNHFALEGEARPKSEICRSIGAEILIDDNPRYAVECAQQGIEVLLFDYNYSYPWSKTLDGPVHPLITRVESWQDIELRLLARADLKR